MPLALQGDILAPQGVHVPLDDGMVGRDGFLNPGVQVAAEVDEPAAEAALDGWEKLVVAEAVAHRGFAPRVASRPCSDDRRVSVLSLWRCSRGEIQFVQHTAFMSAYVVRLLHGLAHERAADAGRRVNPEDSIRQVSGLI